MPVEFLTDEQAAKYAAYDGAPSRTELERFFFLDDADRALIEPKRRAHNRLGFAVQMTTVRFLGVFLDDPTDVPAEAVDYLAEQLGVADRSALKAYGERENTRLDHVRELRRVLEYTEFAESEAELRAWVDARAWTTGEGPKALFDAAAGWLRERRVLLPGVTTLARLVAAVREAEIAALFELTPPLDSDADEAWRAQLVTRFGTVRPFLKLLVTVVDFGATPEGLPVLKALKSLPDLMGRKKVGPAEIDTDLLTGSWRRLVLSAPHLEPGTVDWKAYAFCVLEQVHDAAKQAGVREELLQVG